MYGAKMDSKKANGNGITQRFWVLVFCGIFMSFSVYGGEWLHFGYDNHQTSFNEVEDTIGPGNVMNLDRIWGVGCDDSRYSVAFRSPAVFFDKVYFSSAGSGMSALDARTGELLWRGSVGGSTWSPQPVVSRDGTVFILDGSSPCGLFALDGNSGGQIWEAPIEFDLGMGDVAESLVTVDDDLSVVYVIEEPFGYGEGKLFALDKDSGEILWFRSEATDGYSFEGDYVIVAGEKILVEAQVEEDYYRVDRMLQIDATSQNIDRVFERPVPNDLSDISKFSLCNDKLAVVYCDREGVFESEGALVVYDVNSGRVLWQKAFPEGVTGHLACNTQTGTIYVPTEPHLHALSAATGDTLWKYTGYSAILSPSVANGVVYFLSDTNMYAVDEASGSRLFTFPLGEEGQESAQVAVCDGKVFFSGNGGDCDLFVLGLPQVPLAVTPEYFDFGLVSVGLVSTQIFSMENTGSENQSVGALSLGGPDAASFSIQTDGCSGQNLAPGGRASFTLAYAPTHLGDHMAELRIPLGSSGDQWVSVALRGQAGGGSPYAYYLPYFVAGGTQWSGLGLRNASVGSSANITVTGYSQTGSILAVEEKTLVARGQEAFVFGAGLSCEGWILVASDQPLIGLDFFGATGSDDHMADITLNPRLAGELIVPHVAQNDQWDTTLMVCNPHAETNTLDLVFVDGSGNQVRT